MSTYRDLKDNEVEQFITEADDQLVVLCFHATWCGPCKINEKNFDRAVEQYSNEGVRFARVNIEECPQITSKYEVQSVPTTMIFHHANLVKRLIGVVELEKYGSVFQDLRSL